MRSLRIRRVWQLGAMMTSIGLSVTLACSIGDTGSTSGNVEGGSDAGTCSMRRAPTGAFGAPAPGGDDSTCMTCEDHACRRDAGAGSDAGSASDAGSGDEPNASEPTPSSFTTPLETAKSIDMVELLEKLKDRKDKGELAECVVVLVSGQAPDCTTGEWRTATPEELQKCAAEVGKEALTKALVAAGVAETAASWMAAAWIESAKLGWAVGTWMAENVKEAISSQGCQVCRGNEGNEIPAKPTIWTLPRTISGYPVTCMVLQDDKGQWTVYAGIKYDCGWWWNRKTDVEWSRCGLR